MKPNRVEISPERLFLAAEAIVLAATQIAKRTNGPSPYPTDLIGTANEPECMRGLAREEIQEGCDFLVRLGILQRMPRKTSKQHDSGADAA
jgi:hypothetical protein